MIKETIQHKENNFKCVYNNITTKHRKQTLMKVNGRTDI